MKKVIWLNRDLDEPFEGIDDDAEIIITEDGYMYLENTATDPILDFSHCEGRFSDYIDIVHHPEEV